MTETERRRHPRFKVGVDAQLAKGALRFGGRLKDLCRDAALVEVRQGLAVGDEVALALHLPGTDGPLEVVGHVVRTAPGGDDAMDAAILFADLKPAAETRIDFFIAQQAHGA
jgi:Tfp pilus assembly protein PilZ